MGELLTVFKDFTPGAYGIWALVLMGLVYAVREWRETRKMSAADRLARREGYAKQVEGLQNENRKLRADLTDVEKRYDEHRRICHEEADQLRNQVIFLENKIAGLMRKLADVAIRAARGEVDATMAASILQLATEAELGFTPVPPAELAPTRRRKR